MGRKHQSSESLKRARETFRKNHPEMNLLNGSRRRAKTKGLKHELTKEDIVIPDVCPVLNIPLFFTPGTQTDNTPSIDQVNPGCGYTKANVEIISWRANDLKKDATWQELRALCRYMEPKITITNVRVREE
jgi:hypothetical protein